MTIKGYVVVGVSILAIALNNNKQKYFKNGVTHYLQQVVTDQGIP